MMAYPGLAHEEHKYLGKEYCTGYTDVYGKWNTGFYCPQYGSKTAVFCCGTAVFKYCCTNQEPVDPNSSSGVLLDGDDPNFDGGPHHGVSSAVFVRVPVVFGVVCGIAAVLVLLIVAACYFCSCCFAYKKRRNDHIGHNELPRHLNHLHLNHAVLPAPPPNMSQTGLYRNSSTPSTTSTITASSNLLNLYSGGTGSSGPLSNSLVTTPLDLDWASSIASTYQSQQTLFPPPAIQFTPSGPGPGNALTPAAAATLAVALSQQQRHSAPNSILGGSSGPPSVISGTTLNTTTGRLPSVSQAYQSFLNSSTSTLSSNSMSTSMPPRGIGPPSQPQLHRANLPQQISTTASIVNSYLASLQQQQQQQQAPRHSEPQPSVVPPPPLPPPVERTRHPSPPPSYFQTVSSASYHGSSNNSNSNYLNNNRNCRSSSQNRHNRMATIQSILGSGSGTAYSGGTTWNNDDDLLLAEFIMRHENTLRRSLGLTNPSNNRISSNYNNNTNSNMNTHNNSSSNNSSSRSRGNSMLTQRELIELLLRLTYHSSSTAPIHSTSSVTPSISRSDSRAGSESHSTASSAATTRSTASSTTSTNGKVNNGSTTSCTKLTINEVDEDDPIVAGQDANNRGGGREDTVVVTMRKPKTSCLDLSLSRLSVGENDSGVASSTCSTVGSEVAESVIGSIKMISRDLSEEAMKLKKQPHAVDDDGVQQQNVKVVVHEEETIAKKMKLHEQQLAAIIHPERNCETGESSGDECTSGGGEVPVPIPNNGGNDGGGDLRLKGNKSGACMDAGSGSDGEIIEIGGDRDGNTNCISSSCSILPQASLPLPMGGGSVRVVSCENSISTAAAPQV